MLFSSNDIYNNRDFAAKDASNCQKKVTDSPFQDATLAKMPLSEQLCRLLNFDGVILLAERFLLLPRCTLLRVWRPTF